jgi:hypothetical protein
MKSSNIFDSCGHLTDTALRALGGSAPNGSALSAEELDKAAAHLAECEKCADAFAVSLEAAGLCEAPKGFAGHVIERIRALRGENNIQFVFFSLRVVAAVCAALVIVFTGAFDSLAQPIAAPRVSASESHISDAISSGLKGITDWASNLGGIYNAEKKK